MQNPSFDSANHSPTNTVKLEDVLQIEHYGEGTYDMTSINLHDDARHDFTEMKITPIFYSGWQAIHVHLKIVRRNGRRETDITKTFPASG